MSEYEKTMLKLKLLELGQNQAMVALTAMTVNSVDANIVAETSLDLLNEATDHVSKLIK